MPGRGEVQPRGDRLVRFSFVETHGSNVSGYSSLSPSACSMHDCFNHLFNKGDPCVINRKKTSFTDSYSEQLYATEKAQGKKEGEKRAGLFLLCCGE